MDMQLVHLVVWAQKIQGTVLFFSTHCLQKPYVELPSLSRGHVSNSHLLTSWTESTVSLQLLLKIILSIYFKAPISYLIWISLLQCQPSSWLKADLMLDPLLGTCPHRGSWSSTGDAWSVSGTPPSWSPSRLQHLWCLRMREASAVVTHSGFCPLLT